MTPKTFATLLLLVAVLLPAGCASKVPRLDYDSLDAQPAAEVIELWESQREVLVRVIQDKKFTIREFEAALRFFEKATGLPAHQASTRYGRMPGDQLTEDLQTWDDWFRANGVAVRVEDLVDGAYFDLLEKTRKVSAGGEAGVDINEIIW